MKSFPSLSRRSLSLFALLLAVGGALAAPAAESGSRAGSWEIAGFGSFLESSSTYAQVENLRVAAEFTSIRGGGIAAGFHLSEQFAASAFYWGGNGTLKASALGLSASDSITVLESGLGLDWLPMKGVFTPVLGVHAGYFHFTGGQEGGSEADFSYGGSAGLRFELSRHWFVKGLYRFSWTKYTGFADRARFGGASIGIGYRF